MHRHSSAGSPREAEALAVQGEILCDRPFDDLRAEGEAADQSLKAHQQRACAQGCELSNRMVSHDKKKRYFEQLVRSIGGSNTELLEQLCKQAAESLERPWQPHFRVDGDEHVLGGVDVNCLVLVKRQRRYICASSSGGQKGPPCLDLVSLVQRTVENGHERLVADVWPKQGGVLVVLLQKVLMVVAVEQDEGLACGEVS